MGKEILICNALKCGCLLEKAQLDLTLGAAAALELLPNILEITKASSASDDVLSLGFNSSGVRQIDVGGYVSHRGIGVVNHWGTWRRAGLTSMLGLELMITARVTLDKISFDNVTVIWSMVLKLMLGLPTTLNEALRAVIVGFASLDANFIGVGGVDRSGAPRGRVIGGWWQWQKFMVKRRGFRF